MKAQHENLLMESFGLWLDNTILTKGEAFYHYTGLLYEVSGNYANNTRVWAAPFKQAIADQNVAGIVKPVSIWVDSVNVFGQNLSGSYSAVTNTTTGQYINQSTNTKCSSFDFDNSQLVIKNNLISGNITGAIEINRLKNETGDYVGTGFIPNGTGDIIFDFKVNRTGCYLKTIIIAYNDSEAVWDTAGTYSLGLGIITGGNSLYTGAFTSSLTLPCNNLQGRLYLDSGIVAGRNLDTGVFSVNFGYYTDPVTQIPSYNDIHYKIPYNIITNSATTVSGVFSFKEFGVKFTNLPEEQLLFETRFKPNKQSFYDGINNTAPFLTNKSGLNGLTTDKIPYSVVYIRNNGGYNEEFQFGGTVATQTNVRAIILSDSLYNLDAISNILKDQKERYVPILAKNEMPFNQFGFPMSGVAGFNYGQISSGLVPVGGPHSAFIKEVRATNLTSNSRILNEFQKLNPNIYPGFVDFTLETYREPI